MGAKVKEAKKKSDIEFMEGAFSGHYDVIEKGKQIGTVIKAGNNKWSARSLPCKTRGMAVEVLQREAKAKK